MLVPTDGDEASVVAGNSEIENGVAMRGIALDKTGFGNIGIGFQRIIEVDGAVRGAGEDLVVQRLDKSIHFYGGPT